jgi:hypothetical protein
MVHQMKYFTPLALAMICAAGCGGGSGNVSGKVTFRDQPVVMGSVVIIGQDKMPRTAVIEENGTYYLKNVLAGDVQVAVVSLDPSVAEKRAKGLAILAKVKAKAQAKSKDKSAPDEPIDVLAPAPPTDSPDAKKKWVRLPNNVEVPETSGITTTISPGENTFDIKLK